MLPLPSAHDHAVKSSACCMCVAGHAECTKLLVAAGASVNLLNSKGATTLYNAVQKDQLGCVDALLSAGSVDVELAWHGMTPLGVAICMGNLRCVQLLSAMGAKRTTAGRGNAVGHAVMEWLKLSQGWTQLHHLELLALEPSRACERAVALLRAGANIGCRQVIKIEPGSRENLLSVGNLSLVDLFLAGNAPPLAAVPSVVETASRAPDGPVASLVLKAAAPWSPATHYLFPAEARRRAWDILKLGHLIAGAHVEQRPRELVDVWFSTLMPLAIERA